MRQRRANWAWLLYAAFIVYGATIPFHFAGDWTAVAEKFRQLPLSPFVSPDTGRRLSIPDVVQNILLFIPFGALGLFAGPGTPRSLGGYVRRVALVTVLGGLLSTVVEGLQLLTRDRVSSTSDIVANTTGAFVGAVAGWQLSRAFATGLRRLRAEGLVMDELRPLAIAVLVLSISFWQPFDVTLDVSTIAGKVRALQASVWQFNGLHDEGTALMLSAFFGMALASYLSVLGERRAARHAAPIGLGLVIFLEGSQIFVASRMPGLWDALVAGSGVMAGVTMWSAASRIAWPQLWLAVMMAATLVAAGIQMLSPFTIAPAYQTFGWFPFLGYYTHTTFETLSHVIELMLLYFPLGFWLGQDGRSRNAAFALAFVLTLVIAAPIEYLQGWIVGRYPDISDVMFSLVGALIAASVAFEMRTRSVSA